MSDKKILLGGSLSDAVRYEATGTPTPAFCEAEIR
jgi:hypothetical protein